MTPVVIADRQTLATYNDLGGSTVSFHGDDAGRRLGDIQYDVTSIPLDRPR